MKRRMRCTYLRCRHEDLRAVLANYSYSYRYEEYGLIRMQSLLTRPRLFLAPVVRQSQRRIGNFVNDVDAIIFDCDGVLWHGNSVIPGACDIVSRLKELHKRVFFFTNNSSKSRTEYVKKFQRLGFEGVELDDIYSSSSAVAMYLSQLKLAERGKTVHVIGSSGLYDELDAVGIPFIQSSSHDSRSTDSMIDVSVDPNVEAVVVGFDPNLNYHKIQYAQLCLNCLPNCKLIVTNLDATAYYTPTQLWAENGAMVGAITGCTGMQPIVVGKPSGFIVDHIVRRYNLDRSRMCIVGDRLDTDILLGRQNGMTSVLTLSGVTSMEDVSKSNIRPDVIIESIKNLL